MTIETVTPPADNIQKPAEGAKAAAPDVLDQAVKEVVDDKAGKPADSQDNGKKPDVLDEAAKAAEEKRILEAKDEDLKPEEKLKKEEILKQKAANTVPEKYEFKVPEGMTLDQVLVDKVTPLFKELELSQTKAQKVVDFYSELKKQEEEAKEAEYQDFLKKSFDDTIKALQDEFKGNYKVELAYAAKVRDRFLSQETKDMLAASGLSNNKALVMDLIKLGKLISENVHVEGKSDLPTEGLTPGQKMYPGHKS